MDGILVRQAPLRRLGDRTHCLNAGSAAEITAANRIAGQAGSFHYRMKLTYNDGQVETVMIVPLEMAAHARAVCYCERRGVNAVFFRRVLQLKHEELWSAAIEDLDDAEAKTRCAVALCA